MHHGQTRGGNEKHIKYEKARKIDENRGKVKKVGGNNNYVLFSENRGKFNIFSQ